MDKYGLIGKHIGYSFSKEYFNTKFQKLGLDHVYQNFDINSITDFPKIIANNNDLKGLNITIPYKQVIIPYLNKLNKKAKKIGAVNTIKITKKKELIGYNTDYYGFKKSIAPLLQHHHKRALILGTGGASLAVDYALNKLGIIRHYVSRNNTEDAKYTYESLTDDIIDRHKIIINCTPVGTYPNILEKPDIPYNAISSKHLLYDLIYNPSETEFLKEGKIKGAIVFNGRKMLELQAEKAWKIWQ